MFIHRNERRKGTRKVYYLLTVSDALLKAFTGKTFDRNLFAIEDDFSTFSLIKNYKVVNITSKQKKTWNLSITLNAR